MSFTEAAHRYVPNYRDLRMSAGARMPAFYAALGRYITTSQSLSAVRSTENRPAATTPEEVAAFAAGWDSAAQTIESNTA